MRKDRKGEVGPDRRDFLKTAGVAVPPVMVMLLSTSMTSKAIAASGGGGGGGGGGGAGFVPLFLPLIGAARSPAAAPLVLAEAPTEQASSSGAVVGGTPDTVMVAGPGGRAMLVPVAATRPGSTPPVGRVVPAPHRTLAIRKAGERG